jgi:hypothetical protein
MTASVFLIQKPDNFLVSGRHSALFATSVERISGGDGEAERMTVVQCITKNATAAARMRCRYVFAVKISAYAGRGAAQFAMSSRASAVQSA